ncbi:MAG: hypothetical protein JST89_06160 [Cyanobacteria bacterium SZAS-4]|nr:hypothetical protein [Cyanobacteria bacterium SZAS-4]
MKIQPRLSAEPKLFWKKFTKYFIGIVLGGLLALSVFVVKDFFFYHLRSSDGHVVAQTLNEIVCDSKSWRKVEFEIERAVSKDSVPRAKALVYEALVLLWLCQRSEKIIISILLGSTFGALLIMVIDRRRTNRQQFHHHE